MRRWRVSVGWSLRGGSGFNILQLRLIGLKLGGVISWPWSMVLTAPAEGGFRPLPVTG